MQSLNNLVLFDNTDEIQKMLFESLESEGFKCIMGMPIHKNQHGQVYSVHAYIVPIDTLTTKADAIAIFHDIAIANFTMSESEIISADPFVFGDLKFNRSRPIEFRSIDLCKHGIKKDHVYFYLRGVSRDDSLPIVYAYDDKGEIVEVSNETE